MLKTDHFGGSKNGKKKSFGLEKSHEKIFFAQTFFKLLRALKGFIFDIFRLFSTFRVRARSKSRKNVGILLQNQWNFKSINTCWYVKKSKKSRNWVYSVGLQFLGPWTRRNPQKNVLGSENSRKSIFAAAFCWIFMPKSSKLMYFWWFSRPRDYFEARAWPCTGAQESKKSKIAKNGLKRTQTIIEVHIKGFWVGPGTLRYHMSQPIFSHFFGYIWGVKPLYEYPVKNDLDIFLGFLKKKPRPSEKSR